MTKTYRVVTRSDDGPVKFEGRTYYETGPFHTLEAAEAKCEEWEETSPSSIQVSTNGGKTWKRV